jgi:hypothetical protein
MTGIRRYRREREFGLLVGGVFFAIGSWWLYRGRGGPATVVLIVVGSLLLLAGALVPSLLRGPYRAWMSLAEALSMVMTNVILAIVYFGVVTPIGVARRAFGGDPLRRRARAGGSYWFPYSDRQRDLKHYEKMF